MHCGLRGVPIKGGEGMRGLEDGTETREDNQKVLRRGPLQIVIQTCQLKSKEPPHISAIPQHTEMFSVAVSR